MAEHAGRKLEWTVTPEEFVRDRQGRTFADVLHDPAAPLAKALAFLSEPARVRRMEESELHHDRPALAGVVRELEALPAIAKFFHSAAPQKSKRLRQAIGVAVRMIMEQRGWTKTGRKGSLGVRKLASGADAATTPHNTGGLAMWFLRAERYQQSLGTPPIDGQQPRRTRPTTPTVRGVADSRRKKTKQITT